MTGLNWGLGILKAQFPLKKSPVVTMKGWERGGEET